MFGSNSDKDGYELFRRAIVEHSAEAWAEIYRRYHPILLSWANKYSIENELADNPEDIADQAFMRAWLALRESERFEKFSSVATLLSYLRTCVIAAVIDEKRSALLRGQLHHLVDTPIEELPPYNATYVLWFLPRELREDIIGDLEEEFRQIYKRFGRKRARFWYYYQVGASFWPFAVSGFKKLIRYGVAGWVADVLRRFIS